jgi:hypothetical protein
MKVRTHFPFTIDRLDKAAEIVEQLAGVEDYELAAQRRGLPRSSDGRKTASYCGSSREWWRIATSQGS